uniref:Lysosomal-associated transmembrane protein 4B n=1 Tax=Acrobeloides nanus TaxID=290746 RepID=A0A914EN78_9BILA
MFLWRFWTPTCYYNLYTCRAYGTLYRNHNVEDEKYFMTAWGSHVKRGAYIVAIVGIVLAIIQLIFGTYYTFANALLLILVCALVIYADRNEEEWAYVPYLVFQAIFIILNALIILTLFINGIVMPPYLDHIHVYGHFSREDLRIGIFVLLIFLLIEEIITIWFWSIIFRAYRYMREFKNKLPTTTVHVATIE